LAEQMKKERRTAGLTPQLGPADPAANPSN
jgi:hypothetical protein